MAEKVSAMMQLSAAYDQQSSSSSDHDENSDSEPVAKVVIKAPCQVCLEQEHKYRCPRCETLTCSLPCVKAHKEAENCSGVKEIVHPGAVKLSLTNMTTDTIRDDMKMLDHGINLSNKAKKENCLAKVGASLVMNVKPVDPK